MDEIVGIRIKEVGKIYKYKVEKVSVNVGERVIVETEKGITIGEIVSVIREKDDTQEKSPIKSVIRKATKEDLERERQNKKKEREVFDICRNKIQEHNLVMKLIGAEYMLNRSKLIFYFTADERVDFRELVKDLAQCFHTRIEMHQIGVRNETKLIGGLG
ncbi:MAG: PSP1 domain-containing protein, partial [Thermodesulfobacteriota bacterium]|nr:PSP1 domain-containing protein [Thermodesulfobacteriota bacterium]